MQLESGRQSCLKIDLFSGDGVVEFQKLGVQEISSIAGEAGLLAKRTMPVVARPNRWTGFALGVCFCTKRRRVFSMKPPPGRGGSPLGLLTANRWRSEEHTSELQSPCNLVCRLLLEKMNRARSTGATWVSRTAAREVSGRLTRW